MKLIHNGFCTKIPKKTLGNSNFCRKTWKTQGKCMICGIIPNDSTFQ